MKKIFVVLGATFLSSMAGAQIGARTPGTTPGMEAGAGDAPQPRVPSDRSGGGADHLDKVPGRLGEEPNRKGTSGASGSGAANAGADSPR